MVSYGTWIQWRKCFMVTHHPSCMVPCWWVFGSLNLDRLCQLSFIHWGGWVDEEGGFGERFGWNLGQVGERVGWRVGVRGNCTISQFYIWMNVMGPGRLCHPRRHKWTSDDPSLCACEAPSHICQLPHATQHEKTWVREKKHNFALLHGQTRKSVFKITNENLLLLLLH